MGTVDCLAGLNWTGFLLCLLVTAVVLATLQALRTAQRAEGLASSADLVAQYLADRCGVTPEDVRRWHREQHPECFDDKPHGGVS